MQLLISRRPDWTIAVEAATVEELVEGLRGERVDVLVLDPQLRGGGGLDLIAQLRHEYPAIPILILSSAPEEQSALAAIRAGARGFVEKDSSADAILDAIAQVAAGRTRVSDRVAHEMATQIMEPARKEPHELLSRRESEVFHLIAHGKTMTEIAFELGISVKTASTYRTRILEKTGFRSNADIVVYAVRARLI